MMRYLGSKRRLFKQLKPYVLANAERKTFYVEPFAGGFNSIVQVNDDLVRIAADADGDVIALFQAIQNGWVPPSAVSEELYRTMKVNPEHYPPYLVGFVSVGCSFGGRKWSTYARGRNDNYAGQSQRSLLRVYDALQGVRIQHSPYEHLYIPDNSIVYCDPPYAGVTGYRSTFDHTHFWGWVRGLSQRPTVDVFVSEYTAPDDFVSVWVDQPRVSQLSIESRNNANTRIEKLFVHQEAL